LKNDTEKQIQRTYNIKPTLLYLSDDPSYASLPLDVTMFDKGYRYPPPPPPHTHTQVWYVSNLVKKA